MKHLFTTTLLLLLALLLPATAFAYDFEVDGIYYNINGNEAIVTHRGTNEDNPVTNSYSGDVTIPATVTYNGRTYSVTGIDIYAFYYCTGLTSVNIPNSVTAIGFGAFYNCTGLTSANIPNSVTTIGRYAFFECTGLTSINIPNSVTTIGGYAFIECTGLTSITVERGNVRYDSRDNCNAIIETASNTLIVGCKSTLIPNSVTNIGDDAFYGCTGLTSVNIPNSVTTIGRYAFFECTGLTSINIPNSVTTIGYAAFSYCTGLTSITVEGGNVRYDSRDNCNAIIETASNTLIVGCKSTLIPNSVTNIGDYAFEGCTGLTSVNIPNSVTSIGKYAFVDCTGLNEVFSYISDLSQISMGRDVFNVYPNNYSNRTLHVPSGTLADYQADDKWSQYFGTIVEMPNCFEKDGIYYEIINANKVEVTKSPNHGYTGDVTIPATVTYNGTTYSVTTIGSGAFSNCTGLTNVSIPNSAITIGYDAFYNCTGLTSINIPNSVTTISSNAFRGCSGLTSVTIPNSVTSIGNYAFYYCTGLTSITVASGNTTYDSRDNCNAIIETASNKLITGCQNTIIPNSVTTIGDNAFYNCTGLTSINIPNSVITIGSGAFCGCTGLTNVSIPNSAITIGYHAFYNCTGLTSINIPNSVTAISSTAFAECTALTSIIVASDNTKYDSRDNCNAIIETASNKLIIGCQNTIIPNSVTTIGDGAFWSCTGLTSINIPNSVTTIGDDAFCGCTGLSSINIPNSVITIGNSAFVECTGLTSINIPNSVTTIGNTAFCVCTGLTSINIPNSVTSIGEYAFVDCTGLNEVFSHISDLSQISMGRGVFLLSNNYSNRTLHVPSGTLADYQADDKWSQYFGTIVEMPNCFEKDGIYYEIINANKVEVTKSPNYDYTGNIIIPCTVTYDDRTYTVTSIGDSAFADCTGLRNITIPGSVTTIGNHAFMNDAAIESVTCEATTPPACDGLDIFTTNVYNHAPLVVPAGCARAYMYDQCWGQFVKIAAKGDANMDGNTSISDITAIISLLMSNGDTSPAADVNGDGEVNIKDITTLISQLMNNQ